MFNACRIPDKSSDYPLKYSFRDHKHIIVIRKNQFFKVMHEVGGQQLNTTELEHQFKRIYKIAEKAPAVGALTSENRDIWADVSILFLSYEGCH
jgi:carnitine O-acetyltransferase